MRALPTERSQPTDSHHSFHPSFFPPPQHYDVFPANAKFSRRQPGRPAFVVSVLPCSRLPTPEDAVAADAAAGGTPVRFSTIEMGDICFYSLTHVELRSIL